MEPDLPKVPCYESSDCKSVYNCGGTSGDWSCPLGTDVSGVRSAEGKECPDNTEEGYCWGNDEYFCSGIYKNCTDKSDYKCSGESNPATNTFQHYLGCDVLNDSECYEFTNKADDAAFNCQGNCWEHGGRKEVSNHCDDMFKDEASCNAMNYFCKWNKGTDSCEAHESDPYVTTFCNGNDCSQDNKYTTDITGGTCSVGESLYCHEVEGAPTGENRWYVNCAKSSWNSQEMTSYAERAQICCLHKPESGEKFCIANPRCQFVEKTCDCGFKDIGDNDPLFMCNGVMTTEGVGYCTWCQGQQIKDYDFADTILNNEITSIEWGSGNNCSNRCSTYDTCEVDGSEILWNQCVWETSNRKYIESGGNFLIMGVDPVNVETLGPEVLRTSGFCVIGECDPNDQTCLKKRADQQEVMDECKEAHWLSSQNKKRVRLPSGNLFGKCTENFQWINLCNNGKSYNYACTWCPSIQDNDGTCENFVPDEGLSTGQIAGIAAAGAIGAALAVTSGVGGAWAALPTVVL